MATQNVDMYSITEYLENFNNLNIKFIKENLSNQTLLQLYIERELIENNFFIEYEIAQLENLAAAPWYKKITQKQRDTLLREPCPEATKILGRYNQKRKQLQNKLDAEIKKREMHD